MYERVLSSAQVEALFADDAVCAAMLRFEAQLAHAQAKHNVIPAAAAASIASAAKTFAPDIEQLVRDGAHAGSLAIPFVQALTAHVAGIDAIAARHVHYGATSQDVLDTALVLCTQRAVQELDAQLVHSREDAVQLARTHTRTPALARTLLQPAGVTTFGLKAARWAQSIERTRQRMTHTAREALAVSLGGATGNLAELGEQGAPVRAALAAALGLADSASAWHTQRESWIALACDVALAAGALAKIANDIALMAQYEIGEAAEPAAPGRGGSSVMPHKRNPVLSLRVLANTQLVPALIAQLLSSMKQEHERALGNWQAESAACPRVFTHTCSAAQAMSVLLEGLQVDAQRCQHNIDALHGVLYADRLAACFAAALGRDEAHRLCGELAQQALLQRTHLRETAKQHAANDTCLRPIPVAEIEACFAQETVVALSADEARRILATL